MGFLQSLKKFVDGNGRTGRLLMNFILHKNNFPMVNIPNSIKHKYYEVLETAQINRDLRPLVKLLFNILKDSKILF
ncbi:Fic family protein [Candidatus Woesearchaeota archaeon]|nr:Fic family protein [Candidatus Woesearchaeota archaeon]